MAPRIALSMNEICVPRFFTEQTMRSLQQIAPTMPAPITDISLPQARANLAEVEVLLTGWGCRPIDTEVLADLPRLRAIVHSAGSVREFVTPAAWDRGIVVSSQVGQNAWPVAQYTLAAIIFAGKRVWQLTDAFRRERVYLDPTGRYPRMGNSEIRIGIVGASHVGRMVIELLRDLHFEVWLYDPYVEADTLGVRGVDLETLVAGCDVVSIHAPNVPETYHMFDERLLKSMRPGATLINTARGALVDHDALASAIEERGIFAVLDVTDPEPLPADSPLWTSQSVILTPHIAGSQGLELHDLGNAAVREVARYFAGEPFENPVLRQAPAPTA